MRRPPRRPQLGQPTTPARLKPHTGQLRPPAHRHPADTQHTRRLRSSQPSSHQHQRLPTQPHRDQHNSLQTTGVALIDRNRQPKRHRIDYAGAALLTVGLSAVILALLEGGNAWAWWSVPSVASFAVGIAALAVFPLVERRAAEPILDLTLLRRPLILTTTLVSLGVGALMIGITSFVPTYLENALGVVPLVSGVAVAALTLGWPLAASLSGRVYLRHGFRNTVLVGSSIALLGTIALAASGHWPNPFVVGAVSFVIGFGLGWTAAPSLIAAQASVEWNERGVVTGINVFARSAGSAVGVAVFGAIANNVLAAGGGEHDYATIVNAATWVFVAVAGTAALMLVAGLGLPRGSVDAAAYAPVTVDALD